MKIALVILLRLKFARQLIVKVHLLHITQLTPCHEGRLFNIISRLLVNMIEKSFDVMQG